MTPSISRVDSNPTLESHRRSRRVTQGHTPHDTTTSTSSGLAWSSLLFISRSVGLMSRSGDFNEGDTFIGVAATHDSVGGDVGLLSTLDIDRVMESGYPINRSF